MPGRRVVSLSAQEKIPFSAQSCLGAPFAPDLGHFPAREAVGIPFCAGKDTFFCAEPPRSTFRAGMQPAAQIYGGGQGRGCQKKKFVQKFFSFWNQQFLKKEKRVNLRCFGAAECWAQSRQAANCQSALQPGRSYSLWPGPLGNHPFFTRSRCSKISRILQKEENAVTPKMVDTVKFVARIESAQNANPATRNIHQHRVPR